MFARKHLLLVKVSFAAIVTSCTVQVLYALDATGKRVDKSHPPLKASILQTKAPARFVQAGAFLFPGIEVYLSRVMVRVSVFAPAVSR